MEISFPFLNHEDCYSSLLGWFPEMDNKSSNNVVSFNGNDNLNKRKRNDDEIDGGGGGGGGGGDLQDLKKSPWSDILTSLILLDEEEKREQEQWSVDSQQDKALFQLNQKRKSQAVDEYHNQLEDHYTQLDVMDHLRTKRSRSAAASAVAVTAVAFEEASSDRPAQSGQNNSGGPTQQRRLWVKDRSKDWWEERNHPDFPEEQFRRDFRMSKGTFNMICEELETTVMKKNTMLRDAIPVRQRVAVCIWRLATGEPLRVVSKRFGLGISTCHKLVLEVCSAIKTVLMPKFLQWPDEQKMKQTKDEFESISGIPNVGGSMYTTHIPIIAPKINVSHYFNKRHTERNQKTSYSITVQGVLDPRGVFTDVCIGWPGSMPDDQVLEKSALYQRANKGLLKDVWVVGTSGHPLMDWVLVPYTQKNLTWTQHAFNEKIGEVQRVAKDSFARLKRRWSCLQKRTEVKLQELPVVLGACCVLHNICEMRHEEVDPEFQFELLDDEMIPENSLRSMNASTARDLLAHNLLHHGLAGTSFLQ